MQVISYQKPQYVGETGLIFVRMAEAGSLEVEVADPCLVFPRETGGYHLDGFLGAWVEEEINFTNIYLSPNELIRCSDRDGTRWKLFEAMVVVHYCDVVGAGKLIVYFWCLC